MAELFVSNSPNFSALEAHVAEFTLDYTELSIPQTLKAKCRLVINISAQAS